MGEAWPWPGISVFQTTLLAALQCIGTGISELVPSPRGPRQAGQFSAETKFSEAISPRQDEQRAA